MVYKFNRADLKNEEIFATILIKIKKKEQKCKSFKEIKISN